MGCRYELLGICNIGLLKDGCNTVQGVSFGNSHLYVDACSCHKKVLYFTGSHGSTEAVLSRLEAVLCLIQLGKDTQEKSRFYKVLILEALCYMWKVLPVLHHKDDRLSVWVCTLAIIVQSIPDTAAGNAGHEQDDTENDKKHYKGFHFFLSLPGKRFSFACALRRSISCIEKCWYTCFSSWHLKA